MKIFSRRCSSRCRLTSPSNCCRLMPPSKERLSRRPQSKLESCTASCVRHPIVYYSIQAIRWFPVVFITAVIFWAYYAYVFELCFWTITSAIQRVLYLVPAHILLILFLWSYFATVFTDVGRPPKNFDAPQSLVSALDDAPNFTVHCQILEEFVRQTQLPITMRDFNGGIRYCDKCECLKPDRSHHCSICGHCVLKFDHHCPWVNTCVNFNNYKYFVQFLGYALALCAYGALTVLPYFIEFWTEGLNTQRGGKFHILFLFFASAMFAISVSTLFFYHIYLTAKNRSTIENFRSPIFTYGEDKNGFNLGCRRNFVQVFGRNKLLWFLPKSSSIGDGLVYALPGECVVATRRPDVSTTDNDLDEYDIESCALLDQRSSKQHAAIDLSDSDSDHGAKVSKPMSNGHLIDTMAI